MADNLRKVCMVVQAHGGDEALALLAADAGLEVIVSDMRMPGMDGATLLSRAKGVRPDVPRVLLTGQADLQSAIAAADTGQLFRFLTKPCPREQLEATIVAAVEQHRLVAAERVLLEETLHGSIAALVDILQITNPLAFGRANRIKQRVTRLATALSLQPRWQVEIASMLQPIAYVTLPHETIVRLQAGHVLSPEERKMIGRLPAVTEQLLGHIPRLEDVRAILAGAAYPSTCGGNPVELGAAILRVAGELDDLEMRGSATHDAIEIVRGRPYPAAVLAALRAIAGGDEPEDEIREIAPTSLDVLRGGMVFAEDVKLVAGTLLVARGYMITAGFIERLRNLPEGALQGPLRVFARSASPPAPSPADPITQRTS
jgi:response regulator RpfG family c-di-GMP phosphodiesterase